jgi:hypothetical protein
MYHKEEYIKVHNKKRFYKTVLFAALLTAMIVGSSISVVEVNGYGIPLFEPAMASSSIRGLQSVIVIPVTFRDLSNTTSLDMVRSRVFVDVAEYIDDVSRGAVTLSGDVAPQWYQLSRSYSWYNEGQERLQSLLMDAVRAADRDVDYQEYDLIMIIRAGDDETRSLNEEDLKNFYSTGRIPLTTRDGRFAVGVSCLSEIDPLGPYMKLLLLSLGLPDLYVDGFTVGEWCLLGHGLWAANGTKPVHPCAWTLIKAGWMDEPEVEQILKGDEKTVVLSPLGTGEDLRVIKLPITDSQYYLVETRLKTGWDKELPSEGVLITYISEGWIDRAGVVKVIDGTPSTPGLEDAALQPGKFFENKSAQITIEVVSSTSEGYTIRIDRSGKSSTANLTIHTPYVEIPIIVDDIEYKTGENGTLTLHMKVGSHQIQVEPLIDHENKSRSSFKGWDDGVSTSNRTIQIEAPTTYIEAEYSKEFYLEILSTYGVPEGEGWYPEGSLAEISVNPKMNHDNNTRHIFDSWKINNEVQFTHETTMTITQPIKAEVQWLTEYNISFTVEGLPEETKLDLSINGDINNFTIPFTYTTWHTKNMSLLFNVEPETIIENWITYHLQGYVDTQGNSVNSPLVVEKPLIVRAVYNTSSKSQDPIPSPPATMQNMTDTARDFLSILSKSWDEFISSHETIANTYNTTAAPASWAFSRAQSLYGDNTDTSGPAILTATMFLAIIIGIVYLMPVAVALACLGTWRLNWRPRFKRLIPVLVVLIIGVILSLFIVLYSSPTLIILGWIGLIVTGVASALLAALTVATAAAKPFTRQQVAS